MANNILFSPVDNEMFIKSLVTSKGVLCGAGFETPAETLFLGKKLLVIPMKNQFEQKCNAAALKKMGVPIINKLSRKHTLKIKHWLDDDTLIQVDYSDQTADILNIIFDRHAYIKQRNTISFPRIKDEKSPINS